MNDTQTRDELRHLRRLVDRVPAMLSYWDGSMRCRFANRAYEAWCGVQPDGLLGTAISELLGPALFAHSEPHIAAALGGDARNFERMERGLDGIERHIHSHYLPDVVDGAVLGFVAALDDVTERRIAERRLRASEALLERAGRAAGVGSWALDVASQQLVWSAQTRRIHAVPDDFEPTLEEAIEFYTPEARPQIVAAIEAAIHSGSPWTLELPVVTADGRAIWVRAFGEVEREDGAAVRLVGTFQDVTEQHERQRELEREQALRLQVERHAKALDQLLRERNEMLDVLAHEVRQPLNNASAALQGSASALDGSGGVIDAARLTRARAVIGQVIASLDNTLAVASLLARGDPIQRVDTDLDTLLAVAIADMPAADRGRIRVERGTRTRTVSMDMSLMRLALRNLLANALKYGTAGAAVTVRVSDCDEPLALLIDVGNAGPAIPAERVAQLFERAARSGRPEQGRGLGLGLYIVRRVMELHGGRALLASNEDDAVMLRLVVQAPGE